MSDTSTAAYTAMRVADRLRPRCAHPWEVFGERLQRYEVHLNGDRVEMRRAPIELEGYGLRLFLPGESTLGVGTASSTDLSDAGVDRSLADAEGAGKLGRFPARRIELPGPAGHPASVEVVDRALRERPVETLETFVHDLLEAFHGRKDERPSFGSVRATVCEMTLANSEGLQRRYQHTLAEVEVAVKASGGAEGAPPGEYWTNLRERSLPSAESLRRYAEHWCRVAEDVRHAEAPASGPTRVVLPATVLADILPAIVGYRLAGESQLRQMMPPVGSKVGAAHLQLYDDGLIPMAVGTAPFDDEGVGTARRALITQGAVAGSMNDVLHAAALGSQGSGNGHRDSAMFAAWFHFATPLVPSSSTLDVPPGRGGSEEELLEAVGEGLLIDQLGYAFPDPISGAFGGELRAAYRIRKGRKAETIRGGTLGGVVFAPEGSPSLLTQVEAIGKQPLLVGGLRSASWLVDGMSVAGG